MKRAAIRGSRVLAARAALACLTLLLAPGAVAAQAIDAHAGEELPGYLAAEGESGAPAGDAAAEAAAGDAASPNADDLDSLLDAADKDIGQLGQVDVSSSVAPMLGEEVTTVSRQPSTVGKSPAAVFVITQEMIRHSGANNIPDLLRLVPGIQVARIDANKWAITARGFNNLYAKHLLVQIDGRAVYNQMFSGVFWDMQDVMLQDIERIEVIRGPGATVWGANAVNGVINIITKNAADTQGPLATGGTGTEERGFSAGRYGGQAGENLHYRVYGKQFERDGGYLFGDEADDWRQGRGGFRMDWAPTSDDLITFQGDVFNGRSGEGSLLTVPGFPYVIPSNYDNRDSGQNAILRWTHSIDDETEWSLQGYYDNYDRGQPFFALGQETTDLDFQYRFAVGDWHNVICGAGYRQIEDAIHGGFFTSYDPVARNTNLFSYFLQDQMTLVEDLWYFTAGSKFQHNDFSGFEYQPSVRLLWTPSERESVWAAVSRAVRTPNRTEDDVTFNQFIGFVPAPVVPAPTYLQLVGNRAIEAEDLLAFEFGYRAQPTESFSWDLATFYNNYEDLTGPAAAGVPFFDPALGALVIPQTLANVLSADTYGAELASNWIMSESWQLHGSYTLLYLDIHATGTDFTQGSSPHNQCNLGSTWKLTPDLDLDVIGRYVDNLPALGISSYMAMDVRLGWHPLPNFEWAVVGRNLLDDRHAEFRDALSSIVATEVQSEVFTTLTWGY